MELVFKIALRKVIAKIYSRRFFYKNNRLRADK